MNVEESKDTNIKDYTVESVATVDDAVANNGTPLLPRINVAK